MEAISVTTIQAPEVDTIRIYWCCASVFDFSLFSHFGSTKYVMSLQRSLDGKITNEWEKFRSDMRCSWWGKMQVTQECYNGESCLSFEFSVGKWWGITNGINFQSGIDFRRIFEPISEVFAILRINAYYNGNGHAFEHFLKNCVLRRVDLSLNFKVKSPFSVADYIKLLACTRLNVKSRSKGDGGYN